MSKSPFIHSKIRDLCCLRNAMAQFSYQLLATIMKLKWKENFFKKVKYVFFTLKRTILAKLLWLQN